MKKGLAVLLILMLLFPFAGCQSGGSGQEKEERSTEAQAAQNDAVEGENILIAYFSLWENAEYPENVDTTSSASVVADGETRYGTTELMAGMIQEQSGGDLHSIRTTEPYPADYDQVVDQNHREQDREALPELADSDLDIEGYDTVFLGYPIWATSAPRAIFSFLDEADLSGKKVIPFCTHDGYGAGSSYDEISQAAPDARILDGLAVEADDVLGASDTVESWLRELGIAQEEVSGQTGSRDLIVTAGGSQMEGVLYDTALENFEQLPEDVEFTFALAE